MHKMLYDLPISMETGRIFMRPYKFGDGAEYFSIIQKNKDHLRAAANDRLLSFKEVKDAEIYVRELAANWVSRERLVFGVWAKESQDFVAEIWVEPTDWTIGPIFEIGWFAEKDHQGQGYVTEATKMTLRFLFEDLRAHRVVVTTDDTNIKSYRVAERCGFIKEGCLRKGKLSKIGCWTNTLYYGMLKEDYERVK